MKIGIIGMGHVGQHVQKLIENHYEILIYDPNKEGFSSASIKDQINEFCDLAIICVPTPMVEDGSCDTSIVKETVKWLKTPLILIKSTIAPGTVDELIRKYSKRIVFSPEYVGESTYYNPIMQTMKDEPFVVFGGHSEDTQAMVDIFKPVFGPLVKYVQCLATEAELAKYMENNFFAVKVAFFNEFYDVCEKFRVSYDKVREIFLNDPRIHPMHTAVFKDKRGFSGKCLPKDIKAIIAACEKRGYTPAIMKQVVTSNEALTNKKI